MAAVAGIFGAVAMSGDGEGMPWLGWMSAVNGISRLIPAARPAVRAPTRMGVYYHENQPALSRMRRRQGTSTDTCPSHTLNAVLGGPVSNYETQVAVDIDEFDTMVAGLGLPPLQWEHFGPATPDPRAPHDLGSRIGPQRAVVQISHRNPETNRLWATFIALRGDAEQGMWREINASTAGQQVVGSTLGDAVNSYLDQEADEDDEDIHPIVQVSIGTWPVGTELPVVDIAHDPLLVDQEIVRRFHRAWPPSGNRRHANELNAIAEWMDRRRQDPAGSADGAQPLSVLVQSDMRDLLGRYVGQTLTVPEIRNDPERTAEQQELDQINAISAAQGEAISTARMAVARLADFRLIEEFRRHITNSPESTGGTEAVEELVSFARWLDRNDGIDLTERARNGSIQRWLDTAPNEAQSARNAIDSSIAERRLSEEEIQQPRAGLRALDAFVRPPPSAAQAGNPMSGENAALALQRAAANGEVAASAAIHAQNEEWCRRADAVLEDLSRNPEAAGADDTATSVADAFFDVGVEATAWLNRTAEQQGRITACLVFGNLSDPGQDLNNRNVAPVIELLGNIQAGSHESYDSHRAAWILLRRLIPGIGRFDLVRAASNGTAEQIGLRDALGLLRTHPVGQEQRGQPSEEHLVEALPEVLPAADIVAIHSLHARVTPAQWREHADAILEAIPDAGTPAQRRDIATAIARALSAADGPVEWRNRTTEQRARMAAVLLHGNTMIPGFNRDNPHLAPFDELIGHMTRDMDENDARYVTASRFMLSLSNPGPNQRASGFGNEAVWDGTPPDGDISGQLLDAVAGGDVDRIYWLRDRVSDPEWRENADFILSALPNDGDRLQARRISDHIADAVFADTEPFAWGLSSDEERGRLAAALAFADRNEPGHRLDGDRFGQVRQLLQAMAAGEAPDSHAAARELLLSLVSAEDVFQPDTVVGQAVHVLLADPEDQGSRGGTPSDEDMAEALEDAVEIGDVSSLDRIRNSVGDPEWRAHADAILSALPNDGTPSQRRHIVDAVAEAFFADDAGPIGWEDRTDEERGRLAAALTFSDLDEPEHRIEGPRFAEVRQLLWNIGNEAHESRVSQAAARDLLLSLMSDAGPHNLDAFPIDTVIGRALRALLADPEDEGQGMPADENGMDVDSEDEVLLDPAEVSEPESEEPTVGPIRRGRGRARAAAPYPAVGEAGAPDGGGSEPGSIGERLRARRMAERRNRDGQPDDAAEPGSSRRRR